MPPNSETFQKFTFDGPLSVGQLLALGGGALLLIAFFTWRDCKTSATMKVLALLLVSRLVALGIALWMLAGPSVVTMLRETKSKSVVFLVDSSASMGLSDPVDGAGNIAHWGAAQERVEGVGALSTLDGVVGWLQSARSGVKQLRRLSRGDVASAKTQWEQIQKAIESAANELNRVASEVARTDAQAGTELTRAAAFLKDGRARQLGGSGSRLTRQAMDDRLDEVAAFVESALPRIQRVSQKLATSLERFPTPTVRTELSIQSSIKREEKVTAWLETAENSWLKELEKNARVLRYSFSSETRPVPEEDWREALMNPTNQSVNGTDLGAALNRVVQDAAQQPVDAVVVVTDGAHNAADDPRELATALRGVPVHIVPIGTTEMPRDVVLHHTHAPRAVYRNDMVVVDSMVTAYSCEGEELKIELLSDGTVVDTQTLKAASAIFDSRVSLKWKAVTASRHALQVRIVPLEKEHTTENNHAETEVDVLEDTMRVLIADNLPRWEFRYLVNLFKRDKHVEFEQLLFEPNDDPKGTGARPAFPRDAEGWRHYRIVILGDITPAQLPPAQQELLRKYLVEDGGNLIVIAGESAMPAAFADQPLGAMIPAIASLSPLNPAQGFGLTVTAEGGMSVATQLEDDLLASERVWREMSTKLPIYNLSRIAKPKPTSHVLISATSARPGAEQLAFLSWQYIGLGRVVYLAAPVSYQLRYRNGDLYHHRFWGQLMRWAIAREMGSGSNTVRLSTDKTAYEKGDAAQIVMRLMQLDGQSVAGAECSVEARQSGRLIKVVPMRDEASSPGAYRGVLDDLPIGPLTLRAAGAGVSSLLAMEGRAEPVELTLNVDPKGPGEMSNPLCNLPLLNQIAAASGGTLTQPASVPHALSHLNLAPEIKQTIQSRRPIWDQWWLLWVFLGCLTFEWITRKYCRMV